MAMPITSDPETMSGTPVFAGTRVPADALLRYLMHGAALDDFLQDFPTVKRETALAVLAGLNELILSGGAEHRTEGR